MRRDTQVVKHKVAHEESKSLEEHSATLYK